MRLIVLVPLVLLASLAPDPETKPNTDQEDRHGFQLTERELHMACAIVDEALEDAWHAHYVSNADQRKKFRPNDPAPSEEPPPPVVPDEVFLRRATLDATDVIPTAEEVQTFLADPAPNKRDRLVDRLLQSSGHAQRQFNRFADLMRLRDEIGGVPQASYISLVRTAAEKNLPYDEMVRTLLTASGNIIDNPATGFLLRDQGDLLQTVDELETGFLGENVRCAVCHDHPFGETTQREFYELASCFGATQIVLPNANHSAEVEVWPHEAHRNYRANVSQESGMMTIRDGSQFGLHMPFDYKYRDAKPGEIIQQATPLPYQTAQERIVWREPKGVRESFAQWLVSSERFAQVAGLREWTSLFGTMRHSSDPSDMDYDVLLPNPTRPEMMTHARNLHAVCCETYVLQQDFNAYSMSGRAGLPELKFFKLLSTLMRQVHFDLREFQRVLMHTQAYARAATLETPMGHPRFEVPLAPIMHRLSAEQLWNSLVQLGGTDDAEWRFASELPQTLPNSHGLRVLGKGSHFRTDDSNSTVTHALTRFMMNSTAVRHVTEGPASFVTKVDAQLRDSPESRVQRLFLAILGREPTAQEKSEALRVVTQPAGVRDLAWSLLNTGEFVFQK